MVEFREGKQWGHDHRAPTTLENKKIELLENCIHKLPYFLFFLSLHRTLASEPLNYKPSSD